MAHNRRQFLATLAVAAAAGTVAARSGSLSAQDPLPLLSEDDPTAKALGYVDDLSKVPAGEPLLKPGANCANCLHYKAEQTAPVAPCALFPGKSVPANAWCKAWAARPA
jgi:hypothetical protein